MLPLLTSTRTIWVTPGHGVYYFTSYPIKSIRTLPRFGCPLSTRRLNAILIRMAHSQKFCSPKHFQDQEPQTSHKGTNHGMDPDTKLTPSSSMSITGTIPFHNLAPKPSKIRQLLWLSLPSSSSLGPAQSLNCQALAPGTTNTQFVDSLLLLDQAILLHGGMVDMKLSNTGNENPALARPRDSDWLSSKILMFH